MKYERALFGGGGNYGHYPSSFGADDYYIIPLYIPRDIITDGGRIAVRGPINDETRRSTGEDAVPRRGVVTFSSTRSSGNSRQDIIESLYSIQLNYRYTNYSFFDFHTAGSIALSSIVVYIPLIYGL